MQPLIVFVLSAVIAMGTISASAEPLPSSNPEQVGLSSQRLARLSQALKADADKGKIPGAVALVSRKGRVAYFEAFGFRDKASGAPMTRDAIFRIRSLRARDRAAGARLFRRPQVPPVGTHLRSSRQGTGLMVAGPSDVLADPLPRLHVRAVVGTRNEFRCAGRMA